MENNENFCSICHENIENENDKFTLECNHSYHCKCIMTWFRNKHDNCPLCNDTTYNKIQPSFTRINTLKQIKNLGRRKNCPLIIKKGLEKLKKIEKKYEIQKKEIKIFENTNKILLNLYKKMKMKLNICIRKIRRENCNLLGLIQINPIYIVNKK